jgi:hypothetical protein
MRLRICQEPIGRGMICVAGYSGAVSFQREAVGIIAVSVMLASHSTTVDLLTGGLRYASPPEPPSSAPVTVLQARVHGPPEQHGQSH